MKFTTSLLTLLATTTAFAIPVKSAEKYDWKAFKKCYNKSGSKKCNEIVSSYKPVLDSCILEPLKEIIYLGPVFEESPEKGCQVWETGKLINYPGKPINKLYNGCKNIPEDVLNIIILDENLSFTGYLDDTIKTFNMTCSKDENNKACPLAEIFFLDKDNMEDLKKMNREKDSDLTSKLVNDTCKSKKCTDVLINSLSLLRHLNDNKEIYEKYINKSNRKRELILKPNLSIAEEIDAIEKYLKSDECAAQHAATNPPKDNGTPSNGEAPNNGEGSKNGKTSKDGKKRKCIVRN